MQKAKNWSSQTPLYTRMALLRSKSALCVLPPLHVGDPVGDGNALSNQKKGNMFLLEAWVSLRALRLITGP